jgi:class 3 adenylate cyclase
MIFLIALRREQGRLVEIEPMLSSPRVKSPTILAIWRCWKARCTAESGRIDEARDLFELLAANNFASVRFDLVWLHAMTFLAETCAILNDQRGADTLYRLLCPYASRNVVLDLDASYGLVAHFLGVLKSVMSDFNEAESHFQAALKFHQRIGAPPFIARTQYEYSAMLLKRGNKDDRRHAASLLDNALSIAKSIGMAGIIEKGRALRNRTGPYGGAGLTFGQTGENQENTSPQHRVLATILFTDMVSSTERAAELGDKQFTALLDKYYAIARRHFQAFDGREIATAGDGILAVFEMPAHGIACACAIRNAVGDLGIEIRAGLHAGECELGGGTVRGIAVHIGARVAEVANPNEVLVSSTVKDLVAGAEIRFIDRGSRELKGVPGEWHLFAADVETPSKPG